jgi:DNA-binding NarL/FixJ family response regulator
MAIRVLLADPQRMFREGFARLLEWTGDLELASGVDDAIEAARWVGAGAVDVAVVATQTSGLCGIAAAARIRAAQPGLPCIALSPQPSRRELESSLAAGLLGFVAKTCPAHELLDAVRSVHAGRCYVSSSIAGELIDVLGAASPEASHSLLGLTIRETEILALIAEGFSSGEIALQLRQSQKRVESQRARVMQKLRVRKTASLVRIAVREGLVPA